MTDQDWRAGRREAAELQHARLVDQRAAESAKAQKVIDAFIERALGMGLAPHELRAKAYSSSTTYRTGLTGWYIRRDRSVAIGSDGSFYTLAVPAELMARVRGVTVNPSDPPLIVGAGGRDGESIALADLLAIRLAEPDAF